MDKLWVTLAATAPILAGLGWCIWWLAVDAARERKRTRAAVKFAQGYRAEREGMGRHSRPAHAQHGDGEDDEDLFVTVPRLLERAIQQGSGIRLNWPEEDPDRARAMRPYVQDLFPTVVFGRVVDRAELDD